MNFHKLIESVKKHEGYRAKTYKDTLGFDTIGYGFAIKDLVIDKDIAHHILERKLTMLIVRCFESFLWLSKMPAGIQEVVIEMCYQLGVNGFSKFVKTIGYLQTMQWKKASVEMLSSRWAIQTPNRAKEMSERVKNEHS